MGFLRKVGRKVNKKLKKVFGQKIGSILGMVGLYFAMGAVAKGLSGWAKSTFGTTSSTGAAAGTTASTTASSASAAASGVESIAAGTDALSQTLSGLKDGSSFLNSGTAASSSANLTSALNTTVSAGSGTIGNLEMMLQTAPTNADKFNVFVGAQESAIKAGTGTSTINTSITDAVTTAANDATLFQQSTAEVSANLSKDLSISLQESTQAGLDITKTAQANATTFQKLAADPIGYTVEGIKNATTEGIDYIKSGDFIPDTIQAGATGYVSNVLNPAEEAPFQSAGIASQPYQEQAQAAYMQSVGPQLASSGLGNVRTFQDLANQTLYGTGTPNYLQGIYQPLPIPTIVG